MNAKIIFTKRTLGKDDKAFTIIETSLYNTPIRASRALCEKLKAYKPQIVGTGAEYDLPVENLKLTASVKNGYTNIYLTWAEPKKANAAATEDDLPF